MKKPPSVHTRQHATFTHSDHESEKVTFLSRLALILDAISKTALTKHKQQKFKQLQDCIKLKEQEFDAASTSRDECSSPKSFDDLLKGTHALQHVLIFQKDFTPLPPSRTLRSVCSRLFCCPASNVHTPLHVTAMGVYTDNRLVKILEAFKQDGIHCTSPTHVEMSNHCGQTSNRATYYHK